MRLTWAVLAAVAVAGLASATPKLAGTWSGHVAFDTKSIPQPKNRQDAATEQRLKAALRKMRFELTLRSSGSFTLTTKGGPGGGKAEGVWSVTTDQLVLNIRTQNGRPPNAGMTTTEVLRIGRGGRTLTMPLDLARYTTVVFQRK
jgi:hypothetical protein